MRRERERDRERERESAHKCVLHVLLVHTLDTVGQSFMYMCIVFKVYRCVQSMPCSMNTEPVLIV